MRTITEIIVHCSATRAGKNFHAADIDRWHREKGWKRIGYHFVVDLDGLIETGRPVEMIGAHCIGHNKQSIGVCYIGGLDAAGRPADTRTDAQCVALRCLLRSLVEKYHCPVYGHRDFSSKRCPCFDARAEYADLYQNILDVQREQINEVFGHSD